MKKKIIGSVFVVAFAMVAGYNVYCSQKPAEMSDMALANVEALAVGESGRGCTSDRNAICETIHADYIDYRNNN